jgi:TetR/AcrR family transcriptional regulator, transcriptional repressor for nem operon
MTTETRPVREGRGTRAAIVRAAARIMHLKGYNATSLDDILRESAVGKGNFYHYFKSKEDLGYEILDAAIRSFLERTLDPCFADSEANRLGQVRCFLDRLLQSERERNCIGGCPIGNLASELSDVHEGFRAKLAGVFRLWRERLTQALAEGQARGEVTPGCDPVAAGRFLVASLEGAMLITKVQKDISVMEQCVAEMKHYLSLYDGSRK